MNERTKGRTVSVAAMRAGMHRHTGAKYQEPGHGLQTGASLAPKCGRRRPDPLKDLWPLTEPFLAVTPELETKARFEHLLVRLPQTEHAEASRALRTFQHRVEQWRRHHGPPKEVFFPQAT